MVEEKDNNQKKKSEECSLCDVSEETLERLKKGKNDNKINNK